MKRICLIGLSLILFITLSGCSMGDKHTSQIEQQSKQIQTLKHEKKELELLLENEKQKKATSPIDEESKSSEENNYDEELESLFTSFIHAEFEQNNEALKKITTGKMYTILVDRAGKKDPSISFSSTVKSITVYQVKQESDNEAKLVGKIDVETKVGDYAPNRYQQLVECSAIKDSSGAFQIDSQTLTNLAQ
ncbi:hypothetical protein E5K21_002329 [Enterococcus faecalis]|uniref:hypothetical protein n=1 Tax=Enterococcus faecalis TaxID=1351 RepID=UPI0019DACE5F|nr:hypothetical protein [Enterococcus faecalis]EGO8197144.1 hypothetical protein [Enterococcus faecalis]MBX8942276.1 hypothetical protein [Enterococcus faecalis]